MFTANYKHCYIFFLFFSDLERFDENKCGGTFIVLLRKFSDHLQNIQVQDQEDNFNNLWKPLMPQETPHGVKLAGKPKVMFFLDPSDIKSDNTPVMI